MITIERLEKSFGTTKVLKSVSLQIEEGQIYGIIGQSGTGKSTLLRCLNGLETYDAGSVSVMGKEIKSLEPADLRKFQKQMGMIFQNFNLCQRKSVYDNVALPLEFAGMKKNSPEAKEKILKLLKLVGLEDKAKEKPASLSGGQKQRVAIARALVLDPKILLCDEATSALDPMMTKGILSLLQQINRELGITIVIVTHQMEVIKQICERVAFMKEGNIIAEGKPEEIFVKPTSEVQTFLSEDMENLPTEGINIQLFFQNTTAGKPVITTMARELQVDYSIAWAKLENFRENIMGSLILNIRQEDLDRITSFLEDAGVIWEVLEQKNEA